MDEKNMNDEEVAKYYEQRRGDVSGWRHVERPRKSQRGRSTSVFSVRFTQEELQSLQAAADQRGQYISAFIRDVALEAARPRLEQTFAWGSKGIERNELERILHSLSSAA